MAHVVSIWTVRMEYPYNMDMKTTIKKKTYNLDEEMIGKVRRLLDAKTDTEAIQKGIGKDYS